MVFMNGKGCWVDWILMSNRKLLSPWQAATKCDSMVLTPGPWLGLPAVPAVTLYKHDDPALVNFLSPGGGREWLVIIASGGKSRKRKKYIFSFMLHL